jgi:hypothetical protein
MEAIRSADGREVTEQMLSGWAAALDRDEWPEGWANIGGVVAGRPPLSAEGSAVLSVKVPPSMKRTIEEAARQEGVTTSDFVRSLLASGLLRRGA